MSSTTHDISGRLPGVRIGITNDRRSDDLIDALTRRGAQVFHAPTLHTSPVPDESSVIDDTKAIIAARPDAILISTAFGAHRWFDIAEAAGLGAELNRVFGSAVLCARGAKARGAIHALGFECTANGDIATLPSLALKLLTLMPGVSSVALQLSGHDDERTQAMLEAEGIHTLSVTPYTMSAAPDDRVTRLVDMIVARTLDVVTFTSAPSAAKLLDAAALSGRRDDVIAAFRDSVTAAVVGPVTAEPLISVGIHPLIPTRHRLGALVRLICDHVDHGTSSSIDTQHGRITVHGNSVEIGGTSTRLTPGSAQLLRALINANGAVLSRADIQALLPPSRSHHAVEVLVSRLRRSLGTPSIVRTVVKRGYRLDV